MVLTFRVSLGVVLLFGTAALAALFIHFAFGPVGLWHRFLLGFVAVFFYLQALAVWRILLFRPEQRTFMSLFKSSKDQKPGITSTAENTISIAQMDLSKRYDIYCHHQAECRVYEDVRVIGIRTFDRVREYGSALLGGFLEIERPNGSRMMIISHGTFLICEHGTQPCFRVLRTGHPSTEGGKEWKGCRLTLRLQATPGSRFGWQSGTFRPARLRSCERIDFLKMFFSFSGGIRMVICRFRDFFTTSQPGRSP